MRGSTEKKKRNATDHEIETGTVTEIVIVRKIKTGKESTEQKEIESGIEIATGTKIETEIGIATKIGSETRIIVVGLPKKKNREGIGRTAVGVVHEREVKTIETAPATNIPCLTPTHPVVITVAAMYFLLIPRSKVDLTLTVAAQLMC